MVGGGSWYGCDAHRRDEKAANEKEAAAGMGRGGAGGYCAKNNSGLQHTTVHSLFPSWMETFLNAVLLKYHTKCAWFNGTVDGLGVFLLDLRIIIHMQVLCVELNVL